jgi:hypothetical protein
MRRRTALLACLAATPAAVVLRAGASTLGESPPLAEPGACSLPGLHAEAAEALESFRRTNPWAEAPTRLERAACPSCGGALHGKWKPHDAAKPGLTPKG